MPLASVSGPVRELKGVKAVRENSHFLLYQDTCLTHLPFVPLKTVGVDFSIFLKGEEDAESSLGTSGIFQPSPLLLP